MASPAHFIPSFKFALYVYLVLLSISFSGASEDTLTADSNNFHSVDAGSILPSLICQSSTSKGSSSKSTLNLVNKYGPCYRGESTKLTLAQILSKDQARVASIQFRLASSLNTSGILDHKSTTLPGKTGASLETGNYVVTVGLGTPKKPYTLVFDTGSDLTWTQCQPCLASCYQQIDPIYNPKLSSTYSPVSCFAPQCGWLVYGTGNNPGCYGGSTCVYTIRYGDQSFSQGFFAKETLSLATDVFPGFLFGCGQNNQGLFGKTDGLLGLGKSQVSLVSQTAWKYGKVFSYCLPSWSGSNGYLSFGKPLYGFPKTVKFTPFSTSRLTRFYYAVDLVGITVGGKLLPISLKVFQTAGTIVDSGTVITRLPPAAYSALRTAFRQGMTQYKLAPAFSLLDTCYDFSGLSTINIPKISFLFKGSANVDLGISGILVAASSNQVCLAFAGNGAATDPGIFGNIQQQKLQVVYDVAGARVGFGPGGCS
ncbi:OLC1v1029479C1 [Oldenlandia corymbosa var. corymbosa]|uniref:OLC1v1029479C1 n=1 Tax=Oldenlandia corymbosa var. corymbosa TaxID=529605 RepID=A0AAV1CHD0_OLDCO|nr:OLC1v1029479C1 [Oldenlandia corymbosa var. corymbosa]